MVRSMFDREWRITRKSTRNGSSSFYKRALSLLDSTLFEKRNLPPEFLRRAGERRCPSLCRHVPGRERQTIPAPVEAKVGLRFRAEDREEGSLLSPTLSSLAGKRGRKPQVS